MLNATYQMRRSVDLLRTPRPINIHEYRGRDQNIRPNTWYVQETYSNTCVLEYWGNTLKGFSVNRVPDVTRISGQTQDNKQYLCIW